MLSRWALIGLTTLASATAMQAFAAETVVTGPAAELRTIEVSKDVRAAQNLLGPSGGKSSAGAPQRVIGDLKSIDLGGTKAATPSPNSYRAYAPSCLHHPLPEQFSGPLYPQNGPFRVRLAARDVNVNGYVEEMVNVRLWRIPCSSSGQFYEAVTLMAIDRDTANEGRTNRYPLFPGLRVTQGNNVNKFVRVADEPNTVTSHMFSDVPMVFSGTYVLENFPSNDTTTAYFDFNNSFTLTFLNFFNGDQGQPISLPSYNPSNATYPDAFRSVPISGYLTGNWYDPAHSGEGILVQSFDLPSQPDKIVFTFAWFTYSNDGRPFWLFGSALVNRGDRSVVAQTVYPAGGGFAGNFGPSAQQIPWGTVEFNFPNCYEMTFRYSSTVNIPGIPSGTGTKTWSREVNTNALTCE